MLKQISVRSSSRNQFIDITDEVASAIKNSGVKDGLCVVFVPHTTAAVTINEGADPSVVRDILSKTSALIPSSENYYHSEGNSDAHIKSSIIGCSIAIIIDGGQPALGTWQSIYFCEFDGPRNRKVYLKIV
ncbi:MAG: secondary thiamine-phosphate synthase enzyme YjbQ [Actinobacteria bacterium]|nr:secondary thiamine-phosphate synthase enzyme YjbQ [Actinomycetota bacterium]